MFFLCCCCCLFWVLSFCWFNLEKVGGVKKIGIILGLTLFRSWDPIHHIDIAWISCNDFNLISWNHNNFFQMHKISTILIIHWLISSCNIFHKRLRLVKLNASSFTVNTVSTPNYQMDLYNAYRKVPSAIACWIMICFTVVLSNGQWIHFHQVFSVWNVNKISFFWKSNSQRIFYFHSKIFYLE